MASVVASEARTRTRTGTLGQGPRKKSDTPRAGEGHLGGCLREEASSVGDGRSAVRARV
jgi:hypothetical protein